MDTRVTSIEPKVHEYMKLRLLLHVKLNNIMRILGEISILFG